MVHTPNTVELYGPFLVTKESLKELDEIITEIFENIQEVRDTELLTIAEQKKDYSFNKDKPIEEILEELKEKEDRYIIASLYLSGNNKIVTSSALDCVSDTSQNNRKCKSLRYLIKVGLREFSLTINCSFGKSFEYSSSYIEEELKQKLFQRIDFWLSQNKPNPFVNFWNRFHTALYWFFIIAIWVMNIFNIVNDSYKNNLKNEMREIILEESYTQENIDLLMINMFKIYSNFKPKDVSELDSEIKPLFYLIVLMSLSIISYFAPKNTIEYGKSEKWIVFWNIWIKLILVMIPSLIIVPIFLNRLL